MKNILITILCISCCFAHGQESTEAFDGHHWKAPYHLDTPKDWGVERFLVPPPFAGQIPFRGVEDIRFSPGWGDSKSENYWSYTFLWYLDKKPVLDTAVLQSTLQAYYFGLARANDVPMEKIPPVKVSLVKSKRDKGDLQTYTGSVEMLDYMTKQPIILNCKIHFKECLKLNKTIGFFELSPQPFTHLIWNSLDQLWSNFRCREN